MPTRGQTDIPAPNTGFIAIAAGYQHSLALKGDGSIVAWGRNDYGQTNIPVPNAGFIAVAGGMYHSLGLKADGSIVAWGCSASNLDYGQCTVPTSNTGFIGIAAGWVHSFALKPDGSIVAWGCGSSVNFGQCNVPAPNTGFIPLAGGGTTVSASRAMDRSLHGETISTTKAAFPAQHRVHFRCCGRVPQPWAEGRRVRRRVGR